MILYMANCFTFKDSSNGWLVLFVNKALIRNPSQTEIFQIKLIEGNRRVNACKRKWRKENRVKYLSQSIISNHTFLFQLKPNINEFTSEEKVKCSEIVQKHKERFYN